MQDLPEDAPGKMLDRLVRPRVTVLGRSLPAFQVCGFTGLGLGVVLDTSLVLYRGLSPLVMAGIVVVAMATFLALVMATKIITGEERIIYYHHEIAVVVMAALVLWAAHQPVLPYLDMIILGIGTFLCCGRIGCLMVGCCHGRPGRWGVCYRPAHAKEGFPPYLVGVRLFPIQAVESLCVLGIVVVGATLVLRGSPPGTALAWYVVAYDTARFCFEFLRGDPDRPYLFGFSQPQWISVALIGLVVGAEATGALPFRWWHLASVAGLAVTMVAVSVKRRLQPAPRFELLHPRHVREVAGALGLVTRARGVPRSTLFPWANAPTSVDLACTSLGVQISAGRISEFGGDLDHYSLSSRSGGMTEETAHIVADLVLQLQHVPGEGELVSGSGQVFHLLVRSAPAPKVESERPYA